MEVAVVYFNTLFKYVPSREEESYEIRHEKGSQPPI
jgi:hypothetical protein